MPEGTESRGGQGVLEGLERAGVGVAPETSRPSPDDAVLIQIGPPEVDLAPPAPAKPPKRGTAKIRPLSGTVPQPPGDVQKLKLGPPSKQELKAERGREVLRDYRERLANGEVAPKPRPAKGHGIMLFLRSGRVKDPKIRRVVNEYISKSIEDLGGDAAMTVGQRAMLLHQRVSLTVILLGEKYVTEAKDFSRAVVDPSSILKVMGTYLTAFRNGQKALGLEKAPSKDKPKNIADVMKSIQDAKDRAGLPVVSRVEPEEEEEE